MVLHKHGERLYSGLKEVVTNHLESKVATSDGLGNDYSFSHEDDCLHCIEMGSDIVQGDPLKSTPPKFSYRVTFLTGPP